MKRPWLKLEMAIVVLGMFTLGLCFTSAAASADVAGDLGEGSVAQAVTFTASSTAVSTGDLVTFDASAPQSGSRVVLYEWDFNGDGLVDAVAASPVIKHSYAKSGIFSVRLTTIEEQGYLLTPAKPVEIIVANRLPVAVLSAPTGTLRALLPVQFSGDASSDVDGTVVSWHWEYGDGATGNGEDPFHAYDAAGIYVVRLTVTDDNGATASVESDPLVIEDAVPSAGFSVEEPNVNSLAARFTDTTVVADPADIIHVAWDFGDGTYRSGGPSSDGLYVHIYESSGVYAVTLYVIDKFGAMSIVRQSVSIDS